MDRLLREGNPPVGQLASPKPQYKDVQTNSWEELKGEGGASYVKDKDVFAKLEQARALLDAISGKVDLSNRLLALISHGQTKAVLNSWQQVQHIVRAGLHHQVFQIGDQFVALFDGEPFVWDVIGIDHDKPTD